MIICQNYFPSKEKGWRQWHTDYCYRDQKAEKTIFRWEAWCKLNGELNKSCLSQKLLTDFKSIRYER